MTLRVPLRQQFAGSGTALRLVVTQPQLRRSEVAFGLAWTSEWAFTVGLGVAAFRDGGAATVGLVALLRTLPSALLSPSLAAFADRMPRERILAVVSALQALAAGAGAFLLMVDGPGAAVYVLAAVATVAFTLFRPAHSALLSTLCSTVPELAGANVVRGFLDALGALAGPVVAAALLAVSGPAAVFAASAGGSLMAAIVVLRVRGDGRRVERGQRPIIIRDTMEGVRAVARHADLRLVVGLGSAQTFVRGALNVLTVVMAFELLGTGEPGVGLLAACMGVGGLAGSLGVSLLVGSRHLGTWLAVALVLWGAPIALIGAVPSEVVAFAMVAMVGAGNAVIDVPLFTLPARLARDVVLARVFGVFESVVALSVGFGSVVASGLIASVGMRAALVMTGTLLPVLAIVTRKRLLALDRRLEVRDEEIRVLRSTPMLGLLPVPTIEYLASRLRRQTYPAGAAVVEQGDPGRSFYIIQEGDAEVIGDAAVVRHLGPGDAFGEIALLESVPRTATVRAGTDLSVFELGHEDFVDAVGGHGPSHDAAQAVSASHLAHFRPGGSSSS